MKAEEGLLNASLEDRSSHHLKHLEIAYEDIYQPMKMFMRGVYFINQIIPVCNHTDTPSSKILK